MSVGAPGLGNSLFFHSEKEKEGGRELARRTGEVWPRNREDPVRAVL